MWQLRKTLASGHTLAMHTYTVIVDAKQVKRCITHLLTPSQVAMYHQCGNPFETDTLNNIDYWLFEPLEADHQAQLIALRKRMGA